MSQFTPTIDDQVVFEGSTYFVHSIINPSTTLITPDKATSFFPVPNSSLSPLPVDQEMSIEERNKLIGDWIQNKAHAKNFTDVEKEQRENLVSLLFSAKKQKGVENFKLTEDGDYRLKCTKKINASVKNDKAKIREILAKLPKEKEDIFKIAPSLNETVYKTLTPEEQLIVNEIVTFKPGLPTLEYIEPKAAE